MACGDVTVRGAQTQVFSLTSDIDSDVQLAAAQAANWAQLISLAKNVSDNQRAN
jgi:hypothetical protein